jgi:hypothetical protein
MQEDGPFTMVDVLAICTLGLLFILTALAIDHKGTGALLALILFLGYWCLG